MNEYNVSITILHVRHGATQEEIKKAFHKLAHDHHPDKGGSNERFIEIKKAYDYLVSHPKPPASAGARSNPNEGKVYNYETDQWEDMPPTTAYTRTRSSAQGTAGFGFNDFYSQFYRERQHQSQQARQTSSQTLKEIVDKQAEILNLHRELKHKEQELRDLINGL